MALSTFGLLTTNVCIYRIYHIYLHHQTKTINMETVRDYIVKRFMEMEMSEEQINHVIKYCKENCEIDIDFDAQRYEGFLMSILFTTVKGYALEWLNKNIPQAWFKPMFEQ